MQDTVAVAIHMAIFFCVWCYCCCGKNGQPCGCPPGEGKGKCKKKKKSPSEPELTPYARAITDEEPVTEEKEPLTEETPGPSGSGREPLAASTPKTTKTLAVAPEHEALIPYIDADVDSPKIRGARGSGRFKRKLFAIGSSPKKDRTERNGLPAETKVTTTAQVSASVDADVSGKTVDGTSVNRDRSKLLGQSSDGSAPQSVSDFLRKRLGFSPKIPESKQQRAKTVSSPGQRSAKSIGGKSVQSDDFSAAIQTAQRSEVEAETLQRDYIKRLSHEGK